MASYPTPSPSSDMAPPDDDNAAAEETAQETAPEPHSGHGNDDVVDNQEHDDAQEKAPSGSDWKSEDNSGPDSDSDSGSDKTKDKGDDSDDEDSAPSYDKLLKWWTKTNDCTGDLNSISKKLNKIRKARTLNWKRELKDVIINVNQVLQLRDEVQDALGDDDKSSVGSGPGSDNEHDPPPLRICAPKMNFLPWRRMLAWRFASEHYSAIDVPCDKSPDHFLQIISPARPSGPTGPPPHHPRGKPPIPVQSMGPNTEFPPPDETPNRIRINSIRLQRFLLDERRALGETIGPVDQVDTLSRLILYKPYKMLWYLETRIRDRLRSYEEARASHPKNTGLSEQELQAAYEEAPLTDDYFPNMGDETQLNLNGLTAYVNDLRCLVEFIDRYMIPERARINLAIHEAAAFQFPDLWYLFPVGSLVFCKDESMPQKIWRVGFTYFGRTQLDYNLGVGASRLGEKVAPRPSTFFMDCYYLEYDGARYVPIRSTFQVQSWEGSQGFNPLTLIPLSVAQQDPGLGDAHRDNLIIRGKQFITYATTPNHLHYTGRSHSMTPNGLKLRDIQSSDEANRTTTYSIRIDSQVMVDFSRAFQEVPGWRPEAHNFDDQKIAVGTGFVMYPANTHPPPGPNYPPPAPTTELTSDQIIVDADHWWDKKVRDDYHESDRKKWKTWETKTAQPSEDDDLLLLPAIVFAFVFRTRKWACLALGKNRDGEESLTEITSRAEPWRDLKLPDGHKEVVQSLITWHFSANKAVNPHFDLVRDKGKGVIILLHGVPGVGKTSTAECAAESNGRPLFPITCGDLGLSAQDVEGKLDEIFRLAQAWGCILLLDEADVFLAQRTASDIQRNALVSVFLRTLEHYEGILFLTTNRVGVFDEAFKSRIHISLYYPSLDQLQTYQIWQTHITKAIEAGIQIDRDELSAFAAKIYERQKEPESGPVWNGRQIRNAFQSALALAGFHANEGQPLKLESQHFLKVFNVSDKFSNYIWRVRQGHSDSDWNRMQMVRRDDFDYMPPTGLDVMNNMVVRGPYGGFPGGQTRFGGGGPGSFPQSTFGQGMPGAGFHQTGVQPQMAAGFGAANAFTQFSQAQYPQSAAGTGVPSMNQTQPTVNLQAQQQQPPQPQPQQQSTASQPSTLQAQYNPLQTGQFSQSNPQNNMGQQHSPFQQESNYNIFSQHQNHPSINTMQPGINLQPNLQATGQVQHPNFGIPQQQQQGGAGFMTPETAAAMAAAQQQMGVGGGQLEVPRSMPMSVPVPAQGQVQNSQQGMGPGI